MTDSFGMMSGAYFIGRKELLSWLNELLYLNYTKVEQCASGAAHCQIMDAIHPGKVPLSKVNFNATQTYEFVENFKTLQKVFKSVGIERTIDVNSLIKAKYQDNLEFLQWIKCYFDHNYHKYNEQSYDAEARRKESGQNVSVKCGGRGTGTTTVQQTPSRTSTPRERSVSTPQVSNNVPRSITTTTSRTVNSTPSIHKTTTTTTTSRTSTSNRPSVSSSNTSTRTSVTSTRPSVSSSNTSRTSSTRPSITTKTTIQNNNNEEEQLREQVKEKDSKINNLNSQIKELNQIVEALGKERDYYFNRLRNIEIFCQTYHEQNNDIIQDIEKILYSEENTLKTDFNEENENTGDDNTF